ncbi:MAG TPA: M14 metallopeptidase family protein [Thermoanaerobaculia bacterium]|nr:M14 metallopeptidase family protein [Thermoanaerobaculia bacterium]
MRKALIVVLLFIASTLSAQQPPPTPDEFLGYKLGERFTTHDRILDYFRELARRSDLITVQQFGETYEHRPLVLAIVTSPKNRAALDSIRGSITSLAQADTIDAARASQIAANTPAVAWLAFGVHGNESSSSEAAMQVAGTLVRDPDARKLLDDLVVLIDPLQNPDGRERYVQWYRRTRGMEPDSNPEADEHAEPWPRGRANHYLIDMNRDWAWMSQRETQARVAQYQKWYPQVFVDFHEMGYQSSYFFPPDAKPINAHLPREVEKWLDVFGRANAQEFSRRGWPFFVSEVFDLFYPGYGDSWPSLHGAIGMTYEVAGQVGVAAERDDKSVLTLGDRVARHYTAAMSTLRTAAANREALLKYTYEAMRVHVDSGKNTYLIVPGSPNFQTLISTLQGQGIRVQQLASSATIKANRIDNDAAESRSFPAGTAVVTTKQPLGGLVETLLERNATFPKEFLEQQRERTEADEPDQFYDLTSWSMPLAMNVDGYVTNAPVTAPLGPYVAPAVAQFRSATYGYLVDALEPNFYRLVGTLLRDDVKFSVADEELPAGDRTYPRGSIVILKGNNRADLDKVLADAARAAGTAVVPLESGWMGGASFGSERFHFVRQPQIALVAGPATRSNSFGMLWHTLDVDTPIPHTNINADSMRRIDLSHYRVLVMPDGDYRFRKQDVEKIQTWLRGGGTIVAVKGASAFLRDKDVEISKLKPWEMPKKKDDDKDKTAADERYHEPSVPGSAFRTTMNERSYLTFGLPRPPIVLVEGSSAYVPVAHRVDNIVTIAQKDPLVSGVAWPESLDRLKGAVFVVSEPYGRGNVITFADEPHFRLFWRATLPIFLNAVIYSPSFPR